MELVYDKQLLYIGLLNLQYVRSSSNSTFDESVASVQWSSVITKLRLWSIHLPDLNVLNVVAGFSWCRWSSRHNQGHAWCTGTCIYAPQRQHITLHCTTAVSLSLPFLPFSVTLFIVPFSPSHTHSCIPPQLFTLDRHCTELEKQDGEQMNPSNDIYVIMIWGIQREEPKVFIDGKEHLECSEKDNGSIGTNCAIDSYRITYSYLPVSDLQIMYWWWGLSSSAHWLTLIVCFTVHNYRFNQILASRSFSHLRAVFQEYSKVTLHLDKG